MYGFSYQGMTQLLAAAEQPKGLVCIAPGMTACDLYHGWFYHNGALRLASSLGWGLQMLKADTRRKHLREASDKLGAIDEFLTGADELIVHCRRFLANYKIPRRVEFSETELSKGGSGKILKRVLREHFGANQ